MSLSMPTFEFPTHVNTRSVRLKTVVTLNDARGWQWPTEPAINVKVEFGE